MKIEYFEDVPVPADYLFQRLTDVARHERHALARGVKVARRDGGAEVGKGAAWDIGFVHRGRKRDVRAEISGWNPPGKLTIDAETGGLDIHILVTVVQLSARLTRVSVSVNLMPRSITARLFVQSLRLARGSVTARLKSRLSELCREVSDSWVRDKGVSLGR